MTGNLLDIGDTATVVSFVGEGITQGSSDGVGGEVLHMGRQMQQFLFPNSLNFFVFSNFLTFTSFFPSMYGLDGKLAVGQGARLVEHHRVYLGQHVHVVAAFDEDAFARGSAQSAEERQWHADDQCTGTGHNEEDECAIDPRGKRLDHCNKINGEPVGPHEA